MGGTLGEVAVYEEETTMHLLRGVKSIIKAPEERTTPGLEYHHQRLQW
jgi:hypothetical protein